MEQAAHIAYRFGGFRLDPARRLLFDRDGLTVPLKPKAFDALLYLIEHRGMLIERRALLDAVWPHVVVEANNLDRAISTLRRALGETREDHRFIVTEPGRGYRFVARVEVVAGADEERGREDKGASSVAPVAPDTDTSLAVVWRAARWRRAGPWLPGVAAALLVGGGLAAMRLQGRAPSPSPDATSEISMAVLPFVSINGAGDEYFSDGLTDELITRLGRVPDLKVAALTSSRYFKDKKELPATIASMLGVRYLLEGSVRLSDDRLRVSVRLLDTDRDQVLWQQPFDRQRSDLLAIQDQISLTVAERLQVMLLGDTRARLQRHQTDDPEAQRLYFLANALSQDTELDQMNKAIGYYEQATRLDPKYAAAFVGWADTVLRRAQPAEVPSQSATAEARGLLQRALDADPDFAGAHAILAFLDHDAFDCEDARAELAAAELGDPSNIEVLIHLSRHYSICDWNPERALAYARRAAQLDPLNPWAVLHLTLAHYHRFDYAEALREVDRLIERFPDYWIAYWSRWWILDDLGRYREGLEAARQTVERTDYSETKACLAIAYAHAGRVEEARAVYAEIVESGQYLPPTFRAMLLTALDERTESLDALEEAYKSRDNQLLPALHMKIFQPLHGEMRFDDLVGRLHQREQMNALEKALGL